MKTSKQYLIWSLAATMLLGAGLVSCSKDEPAATAQGENLPIGEYPLTLTVSVDGTMTRADGKDTWTAGDQIGVQMGDGTASQYVIDSGGASASPASVDQMLYWQNTASADITAWYPYEAQSNVDISNQSGGFADFDYLTAIAENQNYLSSTSLTFEHQMAKVSYTLVQDGNSISEADFAKATVQIAGYTKASFSNGVLTGGTDGWITPTSDGEALLVPQDMTGKEFIKVTIGSDTFVYTPSTTSDGNLQAGCQNDYTIAISTFTYKTDLSTAAVGDLLTSDGRLISVDDIDSVTDEMMEDVIGVVFYAGHHASDNSDYSSTGIGQQKCHGYAVALADASTNNCLWGSTGTLGNYVTDNRTNPTTDWSGYKYTQNMINAAGGKTSLNASSASGYPAAYYAVVAYENTVSAPSGTSGWFLPSIGQIYEVVTNNSGYITSAGGSDLSYWDNYWSSSEDSSSPEGNAIRITVYSKSPEWGVKDSYQYYIRSILAF